MVRRYQPPSCSAGLPAIAATRMGHLLLVFSELRHGLGSPWRAHQSGCAGHLPAVIGFRSPKLQVTQGFGGNWRALRS